MNKCFYFISVEIEYIEYDLITMYRYCLIYLKVKHYFYLLRMSINYSTFLVNMAKLLKNDLQY